MANLKILYGVTLDTGRRLADKVENELDKKGIKFLTIRRYRKDGVYQYLKTNENDNIVVVLEENLQGNSPYFEDELVQLTDLGQNKVIFILSRDHYGKKYMKLLYICGILNAIFADEVSAHKINELIMSGRTNEEARSYYGIETSRDAEKKRNIVNTIELNNYLAYIEEGSPIDEAERRFEFAVSRLGEEENRALAESLPTLIKLVLEHNQKFIYYKNKKKKFVDIGLRLLFNGKKKKEFTKSLNLDIENNPEGEKPSGAILQMADCLKKIDD